MKRAFACDPGKRASVLNERGFDRLAMVEVFADRQRLHFPDAGFDYGEECRVTIGKAHGMVFTGIY